MYIHSFTGGTYMYKVLVNWCTLHLYVCMGAWYTVSRWVWLLHSPVHATNLPHGDTTAEVLGDMCVGTDWKLSPRRLHTTNICSQQDMMKRPLEDMSRAIMGCRWSCVGQGRKEDEMHWGKVGGNQKQELWLFTQLQSRSLVQWLVSDWWTNSCKGCTQL